MKNIKLLCGTLMFLLVMVFALCGCGGTGDTASSEDPVSDDSYVAEEETTTTETTTEVQLEAQEMPENEHIFVNKFDSRPSKVIVENPTDTAYYIKFDNKDGDTMFAFFVRPQSTTPMYMGVGTYEMKYACGDTWYGEEHLFGENTRYAKDKDDWVFESGKGWTLTLQPQVGGNVSTETLSEDEF